MPEPNDSGETPNQESSTDSPRDGEMPSEDRRDAQESEQNEPEQTPDSDQLRRGLSQERDQRKKAERQLAALRSEYEKLQDATKSEAEKAVSQARREGYDEAVKKTNTRLVRAEAKAVAAADGWRDPDDALRYVDVDDVTVSEHGDVDSKAIKDALTEVAKAKPYLLAEPATARSRTSRPTASATRNGSGEAQKADMDTWLRRRRPAR